MDVLNGLIALLGGDIVTIILKLVLGAGIGVATFFIVRWIKQEQAKAVQGQTDQGRTDDQGAIDDQNKIIGDDAKKSEDDIEKLIRDRTQPKP